jgi:hypothetical protein
MSLSLLSIHAWPRSTRPFGPSCRGGASSLLRLAGPATRRLPSRLQLAQWAQRAASAFDADPRDGILSTPSDRTARAASFRSLDDERRAA